MNRIIHSDYAEQATLEAACAAIRLWWSDHRHGARDEHLEEALQEAARMALSARDEKGRAEIAALNRARAANGKPPINLRDAAAIANVILNRFRKANLEREALGRITTSTSDADECDAMRECAAARRDDANYSHDPAEQIELKYEMIRPFVKKRLAACARGGRPLGDFGEAQLLALQAEIDALDRKAKSAGKSGGAA